MTYKKLQVELRRGYFVSLHPKLKGNSPEAAITNVIRGVIRDFGEIPSYVGLWSKDGECFDRRPRNYGSCSTGATYRGKVQ